jgi:hypothetical protein
VSDRIQQLCDMGVVGGDEMMGLKKRLTRVEAKGHRIGRLLASWHQVYDLMIRMRDHNVRFHPDADDYCDVI